jgi:hypothetical protein
VCTIGGTQNVRCQNLTRFLHLEFWHFGSFMNGVDLDFDAELNLSPTEIEVSPRGQRIPELSVRCCENCHDHASVTFGLVNHIADCKFSHGNSKN